MIVVIDGPAGTGKSTVARAVANHFGYVYFNTGAMYRAITLKFIRENIVLSDLKAVQTALDNFDFRIAPGEQYFLGEENVTHLLTSEEVTKKVSAISAISDVREALVRLQRNCGMQGNAVFEGRDMGTVVFPSADVKVFLMARPEERARRRYLEMKVKDPDLEMTELDILVDINRRDQLDADRIISPMKPAEDAWILDCSDLSIDEVVMKICSRMRCCEE